MCVRVCARARAPVYGATDPKGGDPLLPLLRSGGVSERGGVATRMHTVDKPRLTSLSGCPQRRRGLLPSPVAMRVRRDAW